MKEWLKGIFSADSATSFSRVATGVCVVFSCVWITYIVFHKRELPDFGGVSLFNGSIYGMGKINETVQKMNGAGDATKVNNVN